MMFLANGFIAVAATKTALIIGSTAAIRPRIVRYDWSTTGTPTSDQGIEVQPRRTTSLGTSTAYTLKASDPSDEAVTPIVTAGTNASVEPPGYTGFLADKAINARMTHQWQAYTADEEIILPATAANGVGFQIIGAGGAAGNLLVNCSIRQ
jgi:hypothetical protein